MPREPLLLRFACEFTHFFALLLWLGAAGTLVAESFAARQGMARLGSAIVGALAVNGVFSFWQEFRAERAEAPLRQLLPQRVKAQRDVEVVQALAVDLVPGDIVLLEEGDFVPAEGRLLEAFGLRVNNSMLTGESMPQPRQAQAQPEPSPLQASNLVLACTSVVSGQGRALALGAEKPDPAVMQRPPRARSSGC